MSYLNQGNLLPFRQYNESNVLNIWSLNGTGQNGQLVSIVAANQNPANSAGGLTSNSPAPYAPTNVGNYQFVNGRKVTAAGAGDNKFKVVGITLHTTAITDENGNPLVSQPYNRTLERGYVQTGFTVPVLTNGVVTIKKSQVNGDALPGYIGIAGANGTITALEATGPNTIFVQSGGFAVGKFISQSGNAFGGYYQFKLEL
jgi:hypothetical protein